MVLIVWESEETSISIVKLKKCNRVEDQKNWNMYDYAANGGDPKENVEPIKQQQLDKSSESVSRNNSLWCRQ